MPHAATAPARPAGGRISRRADENYRNYRLIGGQQGVRFAAVAYAGKRQAFSVDGEDLDQALAKLRQSIDLDFVARAERWGEGGPSVEDFELALDLSSTKYTAVQRHVIDRIGIEGERPLTLQQLQRRTEFTEEAILRALARTAKVLAEMIHLKIPSGSSSAESAIELIVLEANDSADAAGGWLFRPEFALAAARHVAR